MSLIPIHGFDIDGPSTPPTVQSDIAPGNMSAGTYLYKVSYINRYGETLAGPASASVLIASGSALLTNLPTHPLGNVVSRRIYRTAVNTTQPFRLVSTINDNITTTYTDISGDIDLTDPEPTQNFAPSIGVEEGWTVLTKPAVHPFDAIITATGTTFADATNCSQSAEYFLVNVPTDLSGVILPPLTSNLVGMVINIRNTSAIHQLNVYSYDPTGQIGTGGAGNPRTLQPGTSEEFISTNVADWQVVSTGGGTGVTTFSAGSTGLTPALPTPGAITLGGTVVVGHGGTGLATVAPGALLYGAGTLPLVPLVGTPGQLLVAGTPPGWSGSVTYDGTTIIAPTPINPGDVANKGYVDALTTGFNVHAPVQLATDAALNALYANGIAGVGATLTNNGALAPLQVDSTPVTIGQRILVKDQAAPVQNGVYDVTAVGTVLLPWILTRSGDFDNSPTGEVSAGDFVFVETGPTNAGSGWVETQIGSGPGGVIIIGTDPLVFTQFSSAATYLAGTGLNLLGNTFSNTGVLTASGGTTGLTFTPASGNVVLGGILAVASGGTGTSVGIDVVIDSAAVPTYPQDLTLGVWYGANTKASGPITSVRFGNDALAGTESIAVGEVARAGGTGNVSIGTRAGSRGLVFAHGRSVALGFESLGANLAGVTVDNVGVGYRAGLGIISGGSTNTAVGSLAMSTGPCTSSNNTAVGYSTLTAVVGGLGNTALGAAAGSLITSGFRNTLIGNGAGVTIVGGSGNVLVGDSTSVDTASRADAVVLGRGVTSLSAAGAHDGGLYSRHFAGSVTGVAAVWVGNELCEATSSQRFKENIRSLEDVSEKFMKLEPVRYVGKGDPAQTEQIGLIAEQVAQIFPEFVVFSDPATVEESSPSDKEPSKIPQGVVYDRMIALLIQQVQKLKDEVEMLKVR